MLEGYEQKDLDEMDALLKSVTGGKEQPPVFCIPEGTFFRLPDGTYECVPWTELQEGNHSDTGCV